jgi:hypothetical protein
VSEEPNAEAERRHSVPDEPELIHDERERAEREVANGLRQFDAGKAAAQQAIERQAEGGKFRLRLSLILGLHREALAGISRFAGTFQTGGVGIHKSKHHPPGPHPRRGEVRLRQRQLGYETADPSRSLCDVAFELDTPFCRRQWKDIPHHLLCRLDG